MQAFVRMVDHGMAFQSWHSRRSPVVSGVDDEYRFQDAKDGASHLFHGQSSIEYVHSGKASEKAEADPAAVVVPHGYQVS